MAIQYFLQSSFIEYHVLGALLQTIAVRVSTSRFAISTDGTNAEGLTSALIRQLSLPRSNGMAVNIRNTAVLTEYTLNAIERSRLFHLYAPTFVAAFDRVWYELDRSCREPGGECWQNISVFANLLVCELQYVLLSVCLFTVQYFSEGPLLLCEALTPPSNDLCPIYFHSFFRLT